MPGISGLALLSALSASAFLAGCSSNQGRRERLGPRYDVVERRIAVDGDLSDWEGIAANEVRGKDHLWFGQGMVPENWRGDADLSYRWRAAWKGEKLYFLFEVADDRVLEPTQEFSYLNDCVEVYLDRENRGGPRIEKTAGGEILRGYELHFLPSKPPRVYIDHTHKYALDRPQTEIFRNDWAGEIAAAWRPWGYIIEIGFSVPGLRLAPGLTLGVETGVCDDDGAGRKSILMWTGTKADFWVTMDEYGKVTLAGDR